MTAYKQIEKHQKLIARTEQSLALAKLKKRRAETRRKIELGGLVIKAGMDGFNKSTILGVLNYGWHLINQDKGYIPIFETMGERLFI